MVRSSGQHLRKFQTGKNFIFIGSRLSNNNDVIYDSFIIRSKGLRLLADSVVVDQMSGGSYWCEIN